MTELSNSADADAPICPKSASAAPKKVEPAPEHAWFALSGDPPPSLTAGLQLTEPPPTPVATETVKIGVAEALADISAAAIVNPKTTDRKETCMPDLPT